MENVYAVIRTLMLQLEHYVFERLVSVRLGRFMDRSGVLPTTQFAYRKGNGTCYAHLCVSHTLLSELENGYEATIVPIISALTLIGSAIWEFSISSVLWVFFVLCCLYLHSSNQIDHSKLWWQVVGVTWLTLCQECRSTVFNARYCSSCTPRSFFPFRRIS